MTRDTMIINGVSAEGMSILLESFCVVVISLVLGFYFSWQISLLGCCTAPFFYICTIAMSKKQTTLNKRQIQLHKQANLLSGDVIMNYKTAASFGNTEKIVERYDFLLSNGIER
mmetsp:Transcript_19980/g.14691  ORF Transcript_19980/g.14691 Transcript_19980/m.14691 type:complete len:114 (+) Transcript_19980:458-799(+)